MSSAKKTCGRCGVFADNSYMFESEILCGECYRKWTTVSSRASTARILGIIGVSIACLPIAIPAIILGQMELNAIDRGDAVPGGREAAKLGRLLGIIGLFWPFLVFGLLGLSIAVEAL